MRSIRELRLWQMSRELLLAIHKLTASIPRTEQFGLKSQSRRIAVSIPSNNAEGQQRNNRKEYRQFIGITKGSSGELETQCLLMLELYGVDITGELDTLHQIQ